MDAEVLATVEKPVLDEAAFQQLLAAAYVLQQQMDDPRMALQPARPTWSARPSSEDALAVIAETQERLRSGSWDIGLAANLVGERLQRITRAEGVAIAVERAGMLEYVCAIGSASGLAGVSIPMPADLSVAWAGREAQQKTSVSAVGQSRGEQNDIALPLTRDGKLAGIVEVRFPGGGAIQDSQRRCCQLMAGLMTEAMARTAQAEWEQALATERSTLLEELERIIPEMGEPTGAPLEGAKPPALTEAPSQSPASAKPETPLAGAKAQGLRDRAASPAKLRHAEGKGKRRVKASEQPAIEPAAEDQNVPSGAAETEALAVQEFPPVSLSSTEAPELGGENQAISAMPVAAPQAEAWNPWVSAARTRRWLEALEANGPARRWLGLHRSDLYLAVAIVILAFSIGLLVHNPQAVAQSKNPQPKLSLFEKILVALDLAEPPANPVYAGNPNTMVWVDVHTALYYCPGAELYGKTEGGKLTMQRDAQIDQFQPAERRACN